MGPKFLALTKYWVSAASWCRVNTAFIILNFFPSVSFCPERLMKQRFTDFSAIRAYSIFYLSEILIYKLHNICYCRGALACSAGVFFGRANVLLAKAHVETRKEGRKWGESKGAGHLPLGLLFLLSLIFLRHNKDGGYNSTNINKQQPAQNTPALQASGALKFRLCVH